MKLKIVSIHNQGDYAEEYVLMRAQEDCDVGRYILADTTYTAENRVSSKLRHTFWIPDKEVKKGDLVSVWTKSGSDTTATNSRDETIHRFYWGLKTAVWNDTGDCAVLFDLSTWEYFSVD